MQVLIIPIAILLFSFLAYKKWNPILLGPFMSVLLLLVVQLPILENMLGPYMKTSAGFVESNFFLFFLSSIFGSIMDEVGAAKSIAIRLSRMTKGKFVLPFIMTITGALAMGGVHGFCLYFVMFPISLHLCKQANVSPYLIPGTIAGGCWSWAMTMPGSPSVPNILPMKYLGTTQLADMVPGFLFAGLLQYILVFIYLEWQARRYQARGRGFVTNDYITEVMNRQESDDLPNPAIAAIPLIAVIVLFNIVQTGIIIALVSGIALSLVLLFKYGKSASNWLSICNKGAINSATIILNTAMIVGFAGVMRNSEAFNSLIAALTTLQLSPYIFVAVTSAISSGAAASAAGGMGIALETFGETWLSFGVNPEAMHRIAAVAGGTIDSLPHTGGQITCLNVCRMTHKESYSHMFHTQVTIPAIITAVLIIYHTITW